MMSQHHFQCCTMHRSINTSQCNVLNPGRPRRPNPAVSTMDEFHSRASAGISTSGSFLKKPRIPSSRSSRMTWCSDLPDSSRALRTHPNPAHFVLWGFESVLHRVSERFDRLIEAHAGLTAVLRLRGSGQAKERDFRMDLSDAAVE